MHKILKYDDVEDGTSKGFEIELDDGHTVSGFVVKLQGEIHAYENRCPHLGVNLDWIEDEFLDDDKAHIQCATHMALFTMDQGKCVAGPCIGDSLNKLPARVEANEIYVDVSGL